MRGAIVKLPRPRQEQDAGQLCYSVLSALSKTVRDTGLESLNESAETADAYLARYARVRARSSRSRAASDQRQATASGITRCFVRD